jgi:hypothetical protein
VQASDGMVLRKLLNDTAKIKSRALTSNFCVPLERKGHEVDMQ